MAYYLPGRDLSGALEVLESRGQTERLIQDQRAAVYSPEKGGYDAAGVEVVGGHVDVNADELGYTSKSAFSTAFRRAVEISPQRYRQKQRSNR
jgi:AraC-like DNA-binding protein